MPRPHGRSMVGRRKTTQAEIDAWRKSINLKVGVPAHWHEEDALIEELGLGDQTTASNQTNAGSSADREGPVKRPDR